MLNMKTLNLAAKIVLFEVAIAFPFCHDWSMDPVYTQVEIAGVEQSIQTSYRYNWLFYGLWLLGILSTTLVVASDNDWQYLLFGTLLGALFVYEGLFPTFEDGIHRVWSVSAAALFVGVLAWRLFARRRAMPKEVP
jgi:hypothetical protein